MYSISAISGLLIAAVLYVPGTRQHEVTPVEVEPVVKATAVVEPAVEQLQWYVLDVTAATNPENPTEAEQFISGLAPDNTPPCDELGNIYCAVQLDISQLSSPSDIVSMSVEDAIDDEGASHPSGGSQYAKRGE